MNAAETRASSAIADCTPLTVVPRSWTTAEIDTFMREVSTTSTNIAIDNRTASRRLSFVSPETLGVAGSVIFSSTPPLLGSRDPLPTVVLAAGAGGGEELSVRCKGPDDEDVDGDDEH